MDNNHSIRLPTRTHVESTPHASLGIGKAYPEEMRLYVLQRYLCGFPEESQEIHLLRQLKKYPCKKTCNRWIEQYNEVGHILPFRRNGGGEAQREVNGHDLAELALFRCVKPKASIAETRAYLFRRAGNQNAMVYSDAQIVRAEQKLCLSRKVSSTTAKEAYLAINIQKRYNYWNLQYPFGIEDIDTDDVIDIDECGVYVETANRKYGKTCIGKRSNQEGVYRRGRKLNVLLRISGDRNDPSRWLKTWTGEGTTIEIYAEFIEEILEDLQTRHPGRSFCFTKDNLNTHKNPMIEAMILGAGHKIVYRAPYYAVDGAIEYVFNTMQSLVQTFHYDIDNLDDLEQKIQDIVASFQSFREYFVHVGFR